MEHSCYIGIFFDFESRELITYEDLKKKTEDSNKLFENAAKEYEEDFVSEFMSKFKFEDYFDKRKATNFERFNYCPYCGKEIDWKNLRDKANNRIDN